jgi:L-alanine-DL-glutamate epimerase-like enolase superfamily enzyme
MLSYISLGEHTLCRTNIDTVLLLRGGGVQKTNPETLKEMKQTIGKDVTIFYDFLHRTVDSVGVTMCKCIETY